MNQGEPTSVPSAASRATEGTCGELSPLPPMTRTLSGMPSAFLASRMPAPASTSAETTMASGLRLLILVSWAEKSVSLPPKVSVATVSRPSLAMASFITS